MRLNRRTLLSLASTGIAAGVAGCGEDVSVGTPDSDDDSDESEQSSPSSDESTETGSPDSEETEQSAENGDSTFELGETAVYRTEGGEELSFTPQRARLQDALIYSFSNSLSSEVPDRSGRTFLTVEVEAENTGSERVDVPRDPTLVAGGSQYETTFTSAYSDSGYDQYQELQPGVSVSGWLVYEIEPSDTTARLIADFDTFSDTATAEWQFDMGTLERETHEYSGRSMGEQVEFGTDTRRFSITPTDVETTRSYTYSYSSGGYEYTDEAADGNKFVFVTVRAENVGEERVTVPYEFDISLIAGNSQYDTGYYQGNRTEYQGGELAPGIVREGILMFEVPEATSSYELTAELTSDITARWRL